MPTADPDSPRRDCHHPRARHAHGTRNAYVADRCRCDDCRAANRDAARARSRSIAYGRWIPFAEAAPVRAHVDRLRAAGFGVDRLVELSGVPSGTLRALLYGDRHAGLPVRRVRRATAAKLLSIDVASAGRAPHALTDGAGTHRRLRALLDAGWSLPALAAELGRTPSSLRATLSRQRVTVATKMKVQGLHWWAFTADAPLTSPGTAGEDDGVTDPLQHDVDEVAVQRAMGGECLSLNVAELDLAVRRLSDKGVPIRRIAVLLGISARTVARRRVTATR